MTDCLSNTALIETFLDRCWMEKGLATHTLEAYRSDLNHFTKYLDDSLSLTEVKREHLMAYLQTRLQSGLSTRSIVRSISCLRGFFQHLYTQGIRQDDPSQQIEQPKQGRPLPHALSEATVELLLNAPDPQTLLGLRDKAMLELLYASGLRVSELITIQHYQLDLERGLVRITGKGNKERLVPVGEEASNWLKQYLGPEGRIKFTLKNRSEATDAIFLTQRGRPMTRQAFWYLIKRYAQKTGIKQPISPHTLRHAFASHLLNHGADLRVLQMLLGHSTVSTTQIYTHIATQQLQSIHSKHHPRG